MDPINHKDCYGAMFPDTLHVENDRPLRGKVFICQLLTAGGTFRSDRKVTADVAAWDECVACKDYEHCYRLSLGKLMLETAVGGK
jgi:hypothetical protein